MIGKKELTGQKVTLRAPEPEDLEVMFKFENATDVWEMSNTTGPYSHFQLRQYIEHTQNDLFADRQLRLMIENEARQVVGIIDICNFDPLHNRAEIGIIVDEPFRRQGFASRALSLLGDHCFRYLGIHQLYAYIAANNLPSRRLFAACGFEESALLKDWTRIYDGSYTDVVLVRKINGVN